MFRALIQGMLLPAEITFVNEIMSLYIVWISAGLPMYIPHPLPYISSPPPFYNRLDSSDIFYERQPCLERN